MVYAPVSPHARDAPLPLALGKVVSKDSAMFTLLLGVGLLGLVASFHGISLAAGRATMEFGRSGFAPRVLGRRGQRGDEQLRCRNAGRQHRRLVGQRRGYRRRRRRRQQR